MEGFGVGDAVAVRADVEVEAAKAVAAEGVGAALEHDHRRVVGAHTRADNVFEQLDVGCVVDAVVQGNVEGVVRAGVRVGEGPRGVEPAGAGEVGGLVVFVERESHDAIRRPKGLFDAVAVVHVDVDVQDARVVEQELQDRQDDVVDVAEPAGFGLLGVVQPAGPVDGNGRLVRGQFARRVQGCAGVERTVCVEAVEDGTIVTHVVGEGAVAVGVGSEAVSWSHPGGVGGISVCVFGGSERNEEDAGTLAFGESRYTLVYGIELALGWWLLGTDTCPWLHACHRPRRSCWSASAAMVSWDALVQSAFFPLRGCHDRRQCSPWVFGSRSSGFLLGLLHPE